jgi:hypothetical protein
MQSDELESAAGPFRKQRQKDNGGYFHITIAFSEVCLFHERALEAQTENHQIQNGFGAGPNAPTVGNFRVVDEPNHDST